jgi:hypothetical protein
MNARPTILGLMGLIAVVAVGMAVLRGNNELVAAVVFALTVAALCTAALVAIHRRGAWAGFAVFGWAQFLICQPNAAPAVGPTSLSNGIAYRLLLHISNSTRFPPPLFGISGYPAIASDDDGRAVMLLAVSGGSASGVGFVPIHSLRAALCLSSIIAGFLGAFVGGFVARHSIAKREELGARAP